MIFALINDETNIVENVVVLDEGVVWTPPDNDYLIDITNLEVGINWSYNPDTQEWTPPPPPPQTWINVGVRNGLTLDDKTKWDNNETPEIVAAKKQFATPQQLARTTELLNGLVVSNSISQTSMDQVLAETPEQSNPNAAAVANTSTPVDETNGSAPNVIG
jgi:hypothetical protein